MLRQLLRRKPIAADSCEIEGVTLKRCLTTLDLILLGIGAIIGAGVFVLTGIAAATKAGPAITVSYIIAGLAALFAALAYAELAASIGGCGSAYAYSYASFGEFMAWIIGWDLLLEYAMSVSAVAIGWSGYVNNGLQAINIHLPPNLTTPPFEGGIINLPAVLIIATLAVLLSIGAKESSRFNAGIVLIKLIAITVFIAVAAFNVNPTNWANFFPFGGLGVIQGAALVFFAYVGFDAVSTTAEEAITPQKSLPIGIIVSVTICTVIYIIVAALLTGIMHYSDLNVGSPVAYALLQIGHPYAAGITAAGAIAGLTTVMLVMYYGLTRVCLAITRDGLLPPLFSKVYPRTQTPILIISLSGIIIAAIAGFVSLGEAAELVNIGTLSAFTLVCGGVIILRHTHPEMIRPFKLPLSPLVPILGMVFCGYLMAHLSSVTWWRFIIWLLIGLAIYFVYGRFHSKMGRILE